jgi:hypothetical protein
MRTVTSLVMPTSAFSFDFSPAVLRHASQSILAHGTLKKLQNLLRNFLPVHSKSNIKLNTSVYLSFMCNKSTANLKLTDNLIVSPDTSIQSMANSADLTKGLESCWAEVVIDCLLSVTEWLVSNVTTTVPIRTYKFRTANEILPPLHIFISPNPCCPFAEPS